MVYIQPNPASRTDQNAPRADEFFNKFGRIFSEVGNHRGIPNEKPEFQHEVKDYDEFYQMANGINLQESKKKLLVSPFYNQFQWVSALF